MCLKVKIVKKTKAKHYSWFSDEFRNISIDIQNVASGQRYKDIWWRRLSFCKIITTVNYLGIKIGN